MGRAIPSVSGESRDGQRVRQNAATSMIKKYGVPLRRGRIAKTTEDDSNLPQARKTDVLWQNDKFTEKGE